MAVSANTVWEVRAAGSDNNGGGFVTGATGTDYSQQNSAQFALTGVTSSGAGATVLSSSAASSMVGNIAQVISGTNFTAGFYQITSVVVGVSITFSTNGAGTNICTGVGSNGVINIGGALASINKITSVSTTVRPGNIIYATGSFTLGATDTVACSGTSTSPIRILGYGSVRGDGYLGRSGTPANGALITTNMASITYSGNFRFNITGSFVIVENLNITSGINNVALSSGADGLIRNCVATNTGSGNAACAIFVGNWTTCITCDAFTTSSSGANGLLNGGTFWAGGGRPCLIDCRAKASSTNTNSVAFNLLGSSQGAVFYGCVAYDCGNFGFGVLSTGTQNPAFINCTATGCGSDGFYAVASNTDPITFANCLSCDNAGYGFNFSNANVAPIMTNCDAHDNTSGNINLGTGWVAATNYNAVTAGSSHGDFVAYASQNYNLRPASPAFKVGVPLPNNIGAYQNNGGYGGVGQV